jgi:N-acetylmuramoyl-L-alanine amidase
VVFDLKNENLYADISTSVDKKTLTLTIIPTNKKDLITKPAVNDVVKPALTDPISTVPSDTIIKEGLPSDLPVHEKLEKKVVLDAGHGGYDPGALYDGHAEKDITLAIAKKTKALLETAGVKVFMTRSEDRFLSLAERVEISKSISPNMFVSVHVNALATNSAMDGLQTYYYSDSGYELAKVMHKEILETGMPNRNIRKAAFWVCKHNKAPSVLLELGFMTNREERKKLASDKYQDQLAKHIAAGIIKYLNK